LFLGRFPLAGGQEGCVGRKSVAPVFFDNPVVRSRKQVNHGKLRGRGKSESISTNVEPLRMWTGPDVSQRRPLSEDQGIVTLNMGVGSVARRGGRGSVENGMRPNVGVGRRWQQRGPGRRGQAPKGTGGMPRRHQEFGRGRLRKVRGSCPTSVEPGIPEKTRGTETSQYPEEKKSTETPSVAASERGPA
jgi:hypothetical protein